MKAQKKKSLGKFEQLSVTEAIVVKGGSSSGAPGASSIIRIRGGA